MGTITVSGTLSLKLGKADVAGLPVWASLGSGTGLVAGSSVDGPPLSSLGGSAPDGRMLTGITLAQVRYLPLSDGATSGSVIGLVEGIDSGTYTVDGGGYYRDATGNIVGFTGTTGSITNEYFVKGDYLYSGDWTFFYKKFTQFAEIQYLYRNDPTFLGFQNLATALGASQSVLDESTGFFTDGGEARGYAVRANVAGRLVRFIQGGAESGGIMQPLGICDSDFALSSGTMLLTLEQAQGGASVDASAAWDLTPYCLPGISGCTSTFIEPIRGPGDSMGPGPIIGYNASPLAGCTLKIEALVSDNSRYVLYNDGAAFAPAYGTANPTDDPLLTEFLYSYLKPAFFDPYFGKDPFSDTNYGLLYTLTLPDGTVLQNWTDATAWGHTETVFGRPPVTVPYLVLSGLLDVLTPGGASTAFGSPPPGMYAQVGDGALGNPLSAFDPPGAVYPPILIARDPDLLNTPGDHIAPLNRGYLPIVVYNYAVSTGGASHHQADAHGRPTFVESGQTGGVNLRVTKDGGGTYESYPVPTASGGKYPSLMISPRTNARRITFAKHGDSGTNILLTKALADGEVSTDWLPAETLFSGDYPIAVQGEMGAWDQVAMAYLNADGMIHCALSGDGGLNFAEASILPDEDLAFTSCGRPGLASRGNQLMIAYWSKGQSALLTRLSKDGGLNWDDPVTALTGACKFITLAASAEAFYLACIHAGSPVLVRSDDLGASWTSPLTLPSKVATSSSPGLALGVIRSTGRLVINTTSFSDDQGFTWH